jgi:DNA (cytosine-5)-methyltransferase 1
MGWDNVFHCEWNEFAQKNLKYYWPKSISYEDICSVDFTVHRGDIDIITGGFPCQPFSNAGKRKGTGDSRYLWPEMLRVIREVRPKWVVGENVFGLVNWDGGLVFDTVCADLENEGFEVIPVVLPAAAVNAPHRRDRILFIAQDALRSRRTHGEYEKEGTEVWEQRDTSARGADRVHIQTGLFAESDGIGGGEAVRSTDSKSKQSHQTSEARTSTDTYHNGLVRGYGKDEVNTSEGRVYAQRNIDQGVGDGNLAYTDSEVLEYGNGEGEAGGGTYQAFGTKSSYGSRSWEAFPTESPVCGGDDGLSGVLDSITFSKWRKESIKGYGNAVVPQLIYQVFKTIEKYESIK